MRLEQYRDPWLAEKADEFIGFYNREFFCLDNFSSFGFTYEGKYYQTVEHAYQSLKFKDLAPDVEEKIIQCCSAYDAQKIAHENDNKKASDWGDVKVAVMERLLRAKLEQHPYVKKKLLQTGNYTICEDSPKDAFWGIGPNRDGRNELGKLWMKLRSGIAKQGNNAVNMTLNDEPFKQIYNGEKTVEVRLNDEKRQRLQVGDIIQFVRKDYIEDHIRAEVVALYKFYSFKELFSSDLLPETGFGGYTAEDATEKMYEYYDQADEKKYGVLAIEIKVLTK